ncbi:anti-sigma factor [Pseudomonas sp. S75]|uniref:anti-sigma factor family protein n=1 Tax=unclassified Pseudomonas TaxID=196821 RepID=UPI00190485CA|nr:MULTISPECIES: anti-sigma factor [unclassified Pseudomonas]MBJ9976427.1 anti-sigma factor [Pseudomonas sp. S30]MBK0155673.1 anti-sigma factor [Pseudomonas sp. S75]
MTRLIPTEHELHAYVDERLPAQRRTEVQAWLAANPEQAMRLEAWRLDARRLRAALAGLGERPHDPQLDLLPLRRRLAQRRRRRLASAAVLLLALGMGGVGGWQARESTLYAGTLPMADAVQAHKLFAEANGLDIQASDATQLQRWLGSHFARVGQLPDLSRYGFEPVGARLLANEDGPAALLVFQDERGERISLFMRSPGAHYRTMPSGQRVDGALEARYWSRGAYNFALVSDADDTRGEGVRQALGVSL